MKIIDCEQGTDEWFEARRAMISGTRLDSVMGSDLDRIMLACELIAEEATEQVKILKSTAEMERGTAEEVFARKHFEAKYNKKVEQIGFCISDEFPYLGVSGDGWIKEGKIYKEAFENKSPDSKNAVFYQLSDKLGAEELGLGTYSAITKVNPVSYFKPSAKAPFLGVPAQYKWQVVDYFLVNTDLEILYFSVYDARFINDETKMYVIEVKRDDPEIQEALNEAKIALVEFRKFWLKCRGLIIKDNF